MQKLTELYIAISGLMSVMSAYDKADFKDIEAVRVINALYDIDSGDFDPVAFKNHVKSSIKKKEITPLEKLIKERK